MPNSIVYADLPESISKEFSLDANRHGFITRRGLARLCGVVEKSIRAWLKLLKEGAESKLPKNLKKHCGFMIEFLSPDGLEILRLHQSQLITLMIAAESMEQLKKMVSQSCTGNYQLVFLSK